MAHYATDNMNPDQAMHDINKERSLRMALAIIVMVASVVGVGAGLAIAYSGTPDLRPGLQSQ